ncbi:hypothetical protein ACSHXN_45330 (plasmid) [Streptomyces sp. HUAS TT11]|uniref:hypothetical protein n=1 Tax=Streptomyces sp. HUAS TT11 TaxID=3447508 RepID=UPI003F657AA4
MRTVDPVGACQDLIDVLRDLVKSRPYHRDAAFLAQVRDRYAREVAGTGELSPSALDEAITADQIRAAAQYVVEESGVASPLALSAHLEPPLSYGQAERALEVLQTMGVVGPTDGLRARETLTTSPDDMKRQLAELEEKLPGVLAEQRGVLGLPPEIRALLGQLKEHAVVLGEYPQWESLQNVAAAAQYAAAEGALPVDNPEEAQRIRRLKSGGIREAPGHRSRARHLQLRKGTSALY